MYKELDLETLCVKGGIFELTLDNENDIFAIYYRESIFISVALCIVRSVLFYICELYRGRKNPSKYSFF